MNNYYNINYEAFIKKHTNNCYVAEDAGECQVLLSSDSNGNGLLGIRRDEEDRFFGSMYDNNYFIDRWVESVNVNSYKAVILVFGLGEIRCIERLSQKFPNCTIIVYEPSLAYFKSLMEIYDLREIFENEKIEIVAGKKGLEYFSGLCFTYLDITNCNYMIVKEMPQYRYLYENDRIKFELVIQENMIRLIADKNTMKLFGHERLENELANLYYACKASSMKDLIDSLETVKNDTAILVSAGPSLEKNIHLLKEVKNKAFILAVDTAIKPLLKAGIRPDMTISVDSHKPVELFVYEGENVDIPMIVQMQSNVEVLRTYKGRLFFSYNLDKLFARLYDKEDYFNIILNSGGSVANDAMSFLMECGFENIIMIGQDLAYTNKKTHVNAAYDDEKKIMLRDDKEYFEVEDINGEMVLTEENMTIYRKWFEMAIRNNPKFNFIDATEGGAKIDGSKIMTLREVIDTYIVDLPMVDYGVAILQTKLPEESEVMKKFEKIKEFDKDILKSKDDIKKALKLYDELDELNRKNKQNSERFIKVSERIGDITEEIEGGVLAVLMSYIQNDDEYEILENIYENKNNLYEEIKFIIDSGRKMLKKYLDNVDNIEAKVKKMLQDLDEKVVW